MVVYYSLCDQDKHKSEMLVEDKQVMVHFEKA